MSGTINFGIDLGTTNSLIAHAANGGIEIFQNPAGLKNTLPSVVAFCKERVLIGDKAKEYVEKDPFTTYWPGSNAKMGTGESFFIPNIAGFKTPIELSALILQELRTFIYTGGVARRAWSSPSRPVSTRYKAMPPNRPATKPDLRKWYCLPGAYIAASLAFANKSNDDALNGQWLVYDLGGGTHSMWRW